MRARGYDASPRHLPGVAGWEGADRESAHGRMDAVGSHDKVVFFGRAITEADADYVIILHQVCERDAKPVWNRDSSGHEGFVQSDASHCETGTDLEPEVLQIGLAELRPSLVIESPAAD